jgi:hypothetical protein
MKPHRKTIQVSNSPVKERKGYGAQEVHGGEGGIRTHGTLPRTAVFKTAALNHSATSPRGTAMVHSRPQIKSLSEQTGNYIPRQ